MLSSLDAATAATVRLKAQDVATLQSVEMVDAASKAGSIFEGVQSAGECDTRPLVSVNNLVRVA